jgi:GTP-binding protein EngB required for normal cell division
VKLGRNANDTCAMLSNAYGREAMKKSSLLSDINGSKTAHISKSQIKTILIIFFDIKSTVHFEFIP